jgi:hypothetical protein
MAGKLAREPLVHFLLIGLLLFIAFAALGRDDSNRTIRVDDNVVAALSGQFQAAWQRPPTDSELRALVDNYVRDEIFYREGVALGLDRDDPMIKRRVRQKYEVLAEETEAADPPTEAELEAWLKRNAGRYAEPALVTFDQVLLGQAQSAASIAAAQRSALAALARGADPAELGASRMLPPRLDQMPIDLVARDFGEEFAKALASAPTGRWEGPIRSGYGMHLVKVERRIPGRLPSLDQVRGAVIRDMEAERRRRSVEKNLRRLKKGYSVEVTASLPSARLVGR